jgi:hypothetical protein
MSGEHQGGQVQMFDTELDIYIYVHNFITFKACQAHTFVFNKTNLRAVAWHLCAWLGLMPGYGLSGILSGKLCVRIMQLYSAIF